MDLSIIILNYNQKNLLKQCLGNIKEAEIRLDYEIIIIDNASTDGSPELIKSLMRQSNPLSHKASVFVPWTASFAEVAMKAESADKSADARFYSFARSVSPLRFIQNRQNLGFSQGVNQGIREAKGKYLLILNPDVIVLPGSIEKLYQFLEENSRVAIAGPKLLNPDKTVQFSCMRFPGLMIPIYRRTPLGKLPWAKKSLGKYLMKDFDHLKNQEVDWLLGACLMVRKQAVEKVGLMDERYFLFFQDIDWCRRFWLAGWQVFYLARAQMFHFHQRPSVQKLFSRLTRIHILDGCKYFWRWKFSKLAKNKGFLSRARLPAGRQARSDD